MLQNCENTWCKQPFEVTADDLTFYDRISPEFGGKKYAIPAPTQCPDCRQQRRLAVCNERFFYPTTCGLCNTRMITQYPPNYKAPIYCRDCWQSDKWDPCTYGRDVDFTKPVFPQLLELQRSVPAQNLLAEGTNINSEYIHYAGFAKNSYLVVHADFNEDCCYGYGFKKNRSCVDGYYNLSCELCYDCVDIHSCYGLIGCQDCVNCNSSAFLRDCIGCKSCFLCVGLRNKEYCFENEQLSKAGYEKKMQSINLKSHSEYTKQKNKRESVGQQHPFKEFHGHNLQNSSGDYLQNCKDTKNSFDCEDVEHGKFLYQVVTGAKNIYDIYQYGLNLQESYECAIAGTETYHALFSHNAHNSCADLLYCWYAQTAKNCFGCAHIHHKQFCILNKQYDKDAYEKLLAKIIEHMQQTGEWGEFFAIASSPFGYNKTTAQLYYPLEQKACAERQWQWDDYEPPAPQVAKKIDAKQLPDSSDDIPDDILNWAILCEVTGKPFKIQPLELKLYRQIGLPIPRRSPDQRHMDRFALRNPRRFFERSCDKCRKKITTTWDPKGPQKIYCEECYKKEVY